MQFRLITRKLCCMKIEENMFNMKTIESKLSHKATFQE